MNENLEDLIIVKCSVCKSINLNNIWYSEQESKYINILPKHIYINGICSKECGLKGYGIELNDEDYIALKNDNINHSMYFFNKRTVKK